LSVENQQHLIEVNAPELLLSALRLHIQVPLLCQWSCYAIGVLGIDGASMRTACLHAAPAGDTVMLIVTVFDE
jgi:hypothetical protein